MSELIRTIMTYAIAIICPLLVVGMVYAQYKVKKGDDSLFRAVKESIQASDIAYASLKETTEERVELEARVSKLEKLLEKKLKKKLEKKELK
jgi:hypothetical protein